MAYTLKANTKPKINISRKKLELQENMKKKHLKTDREEEIVGHDLFL